MKTVWILTTEYNMYDQCGEYFVEVYSTKPSHRDLASHSVPQNRWRHVLNGGGRVHVEDQWWHLREITPTQPQEAAR